MTLEKTRMAVIGFCLVLALMTAGTTFAATITVDDTNCTLSAAITAANSDSNSHNSNCTAGSGADTIVLGDSWSSPNTLAQALPNISSDITIEGNIKELDGNNSYRIFHVETGAKLTLKNLTLTSGTAGGSTGGAIYINIHGQARLEGVTVTSSGADQGGGIFANGSLTIINSVITNNGATTSGGGLHVGPAGSATIQGSEISNGSAGSGGGIYAQGPLTIINSTLLGNRANGSEGGGGIYVQSSSTTITHATLYGNDKGSTSTKGADILVKGGSLSLRNSILADDNTSDNDDNCSVDAQSGTLSQNVGNVIQHGSGGCTSNKTNASTDTATGAPQYITLNSDSDAIGLGVAAFCKSVKVDQRGFYRPESGCDAGSVERDGFNYIYVDAAGQCTLPEAINSANNDSADPGCIAGVEDDAATDLIWLQKDVTTGSTLPNINSKIIIDGGRRSVAMTGAADIFAVGSSPGDLTLRNITVSGGDGTSGGAITVSGGLSLQNCIFRNNRSRASTGGGGAIEYLTTSSGGTIDRCAFIDNRSQNVAGAINIGGGTITISNSLFYKNHSRFSGGAIRIAGGTSTLAQVTIWDNTTNSAGAITGIQAQSGTVNIYNSIIGRSSAQGEALCGGTFNNSSAERGIITFNGPQTDSCGTVTVANPQLGALTGSIPYLPLGSGSPAIGKGIDAQCANYPIDQAGNARPATKCDAGAVQFIPAPPQSKDNEPEGARRSSPRSPTATPVCSGDWLIRNTGIRVRATYGLCSGVQFKRLEAGWLTGNQRVEAGFIDGVDVFGYAEQGVEVCFPAYGAMVLLDASTSPRQIVPLEAYLDGHLTCGAFAKAGTAVLISADSGLSTAPVSGPPPTGLSGCMVTTTHILNLRAAPGGEVIGTVSYNATLTALSRTDAWFEVDANGVTGWISADYVTTAGDCDM